MEKCSAGWKYLMCVYPCVRFTGDFKRRLPRTPSTGTMSSADDLDERGPPSPLDNGWYYRPNSVIVSVCDHRCVVIPQVCVYYASAELLAPMFLQLHRWAGC